MLPKPLRVKRFVNGQRHAIRNKSVCGRGVERVEKECGQGVDKVWKECGQRVEYEWVNLGSPGGMRFFTKYSTHGLLKLPHIHSVARGRREPLSPNTPPRSVRADEYFASSRPEGP